MIAFDRVTKKYGAVTALKEVSFQVSSGRIVGLLGRNGAGKTTALNILSGYFPPTRGTVTIEGLSMAEQSRACKRKIGYLPERPPLYEELTVEEYLNFVCDLKEVLPRARRAHVEEILERCGLRDVRHRLTGHLSRGYRQRTGIAQALCGNPDLLILDEPTAGLDPKQTAEMRTLIRQLGEGHTVIFSSHILSEVQQLCSGAVILKEGRLVRCLDLTAPEGNLVRLRITAAGEEKRLLPALKALPCVRTAEQLESAPGECRLRLICERNGSGGRAEDQIFRLLGELNAPLRELTEERQTLEELFLRDTE